MLQRHRIICFVYKNRDCCSCVITFLLLNFKRNLFSAWSKRGKKRPMIFNGVLIRDRVCEVLGCLLPSCLIALRFYFKYGMIMDYGLGSGFNESCLRNLFSPTNLSPVAPCIADGPSTMHPFFAPYSLAITRKLESFVVFI